ncbi:MAG: S-layer homology domain-containing protein [Acutalibacter sp.]|jgi:uncharacterized repeat protein (TIGR02543 family)
MQKRILSVVLVLCLILGMVPAIRIPAAAAEGGGLTLPKGEGSGKGFIYYNFKETTEFASGTTYAFLDGVYSQQDAVAQLGSGAVLQATSQANNSTKYINRVYHSTKVAAYVKVETPGKGFDHCAFGGLYQMPDTSNPIEYRYFCWAGGAQDCGPLYAYTYDTAEITWENVTVSLKDPGNTQSNDSADYTVELRYDGDKVVTLDPRSYTVQCSGRTATVAITDNAGNTIRGNVTLPCGVMYQPGGLNVTGMPSNQGMLSGGSVTVAQGPAREGYAFQNWTDGTQTFTAGSVISYKAENNYTLTAVWKDIQAPQFEWSTVEVITGTSGEVVQNSIKAMLKITDNEPVSECTITVDADDTTAQIRGEKEISVTVTDKAKNTTTKNVTLKVLPGPLSFTEPAYNSDSKTLSATLREPGPDTLTETGIVWSVVNNPTTTVNNGIFTTDKPVMAPDTSLSTQVELAKGVTYYARAYAKVGGITYYGSQATIGEDVPAYGVFTITNSGSSTFTVSRANGDDGAQTVYYRTVNGSAVGGIHFTHQSGTLNFAPGETSKTITIAEQGVNVPYNGNAATGYANDVRTYSVEIYRVDGGAVIEDNRDAATRTMTGNKSVDRSEFDEKKVNGDTVEKERGDYEDDGKKGWTNGELGAEDQRDTISVQPAEAIRPYVQAVSQEIQYYVTFEAREGESGYQTVQIVPGSTTDTSIYPYKGDLKGAYSSSVGYTVVFEHGGADKNTNWSSYRFPPTSGSVTISCWQGPQYEGYIAFPVDTQQVTTSYGASGEGSDTWYTKNVVYHYRFVDTKEPTLLAVGSMGDSTYRVGDSFTVSLIFNEIVDSQNSNNLSSTTISTSWGTATYSGGANTNVLYFTGTVSADASSPLSVTGISSAGEIKDMAGNAAKSVSGSVTASVNTNTPSFTLSAGSISGGVGRATISSANEHTTSLRYVWSKSQSMPATGWIPLTSTELSAAKTSGGFQAMTRQEAGSGIWYLHVLGVCDTNGALSYKKTSVDFGTGGTIPGDSNPVQPPTISVSVDNTNWAKNRTLTVTAASGAVEYRYGEDGWKSVSGGSVTVDKNGTYTFRCVANGEAATTSVTVEKIDSVSPMATIGAMVANTPTQKSGVYHSVTLPIAYRDTQSGIKTVEYVWSNLPTVPEDGWSSVKTDETQLTYNADETNEMPIYLYLRVTDQVGNTVTIGSEAYTVISKAGAEAYAPTVTIGLPTEGVTGFTPWDGDSWTNETQTLEWKLSGVKDQNYVVTLPDGRTTADDTGTILVSQNGTYTVSVVDNTYGGSNSASCTIEKIDTTAPTVTHTQVPTGWQQAAVTIDFTFADQGGSGLGTAQYKVVGNHTETPSDLTAFPANTGGSVTVSQDGEWYIYYEVTDNTAGKYGDGTFRAANTTSGFVGPVRINTSKPTLEISGGKTGASSLHLTVTSHGSESVTVAKDGGQALPVNGSYTVTEAGIYTFTATSNAGLTTTEEVQVHSITFDSGVARQLVVSGGRATEPDGPQKTGYAFGGWYSGQKEWNFADLVTTDLTLAAQWTLEVPDVTLTADKTEVTYGEKITLTADANHSGGAGVPLTYAWYKDGNLLSGKVEKTLTLSDVADSGSYYVVVTASGDGQTQTSTSSSVEVTIVPLLVTLRWDYTGPIPYDAKSHTVTAIVDNLVEGDSCGLTYEGTREAVNVDSYEVTVTGLDNPNYTLDGVENTTLVWQIIKASGNAFVTLADWTYDGTAQNEPIPESATHGTENVTYYYTGITTSGAMYNSTEIPTDAGTYTVTATFGSTANYEEVTITDGFTIAPRPVELTWSGETETSYDGSEHVVAAIITNLVSGDSCELTYENCQKTDAGNYTAKVTALSNPNYTLDGGTNTTQEWQIRQVQGLASVTMANWTYGEAPKVPVPVSDTNGTDHVTYHYTGTTSGNAAYDSGDVPTDAGKYTVTATFEATTNHTEVSAAAEFSIAPKTITATWSELTQVYGDTKKIQVTLSGVVSGDDVAVDVAGAGQTAGSFDLTAALDGAHAANYLLKNDKATLTIQRKPVVITVTNNATTVDKITLPMVNVPGLEEDEYEIIYKNEDGMEVTNPTEVGSYEVWVKFPDDSNYCHSHGGSEAQVGTFLIADILPCLYTVTFAGGNGAEDAMDPLETVGGSVLTLPDCDLEKEEYRFTGWMYGGKTYQPGDSFIMPARDVTFVAQWQQEFEVTGTVSEKTDGADVATVSNAVVSLWLGAHKIQEITTGSDGKYVFHELIPGIYNLVVTKDVRTVTSKVEITTENKISDATLPKGATNSIVDVALGSPNIVVGNLDKVFEKTDDTVYTETDKTNVEAGGKVEITFTAEEKQQEDGAIAEDMEKIAQLKNNSVTLGLVMDYTLKKEVTTMGQPTAERKLIPQSNVPLEVLLPLPTELQGKTSYTVYRVHSDSGQAADKQAQQLKEGKTNQNQLGEYFTVSSDKTKLILYVKCFSTYAVGYTESTGGGGVSAPTYHPNVTQTEHGTVSVSPASPEEGDQVTITATPEEGYTVGTVTVTDVAGQGVEVTSNNDGTYTFVQPSGQVTITVTFRKLANAEKCPQDESCPMADFVDMRPADWYHDGVHYCLDEEIMAGTSGTTFQPNASLSRAMVAQILYNLEKQPVVTASSSFTDVSGHWAVDAITWAEQAGVVSGYGNDTFQPERSVSREELAQMLYNYATIKGYDLAAEGDLSRFPDGGKVQPWAAIAMKWANGNRLINGHDNGTLDPGGNATRAQAATIFMGFCLGLMK